MVVSTHNCKLCRNNCDCVSLQPTLCMCCKTCKATKRLVNEKVVGIILKSPMTDEEIAEAMSGGVED